MSKINEYGEIIRDGSSDGRVTNDIPMFTPPEQEKLTEILREIENYIETKDYSQVIRIKDKFVENIKGDYLSFLLNGIGINNENIITYAVNDFENMEFEISKMILLRMKRNIDAKSKAVKNELSNNEIDNSKKINRINEQINEKPMDYYERAKQIVIDTMKDCINQLERTLDYEGVNISKINEISNEIRYKINEYVNVYVERLNDQLIELDKKIQKYVEALVESYMKREQFREDTKVPNENNQIEKKAIAEVESKSEKSSAVRSRFNDEPSYENNGSSLDADGIFDSKDTKGKSVADLFNDDLDDKDIF